MADPLPLTRAHRVAVIGGGPGGLMAAEVLAGAGASVTVYERMPSVGRKLLLAGRGGLNLTHSEPLGDLLERYGPARAVLEPTIAAFGPTELRAWCAGLGQEPFVGSSGRVFPAGFRATPLLRAWLHRLDELGVTIEVRQAWRGWAQPSGAGNDVAVADRAADPLSSGADVVVADRAADPLSSGADVVVADRAADPLSSGADVVVADRAADPLSSGADVVVADRAADPLSSGADVVVADRDDHERVVAADAVVLALGGASWPRVGSDGGWVPVVRAAGIEVSPLRPANAGFDVGWTPTFASRFAGTPVKNVAIVAPDGAPARGDLMVTSTGIEGGVVYAVGAALRDTLAVDGQVALAIDLLPDIPVTTVADRLGRRRSKDSTSTALRRTLGLSPVAIGLLREATGNRLPDDAGGLAALIKSAPVVLTGVRPIDRAISTAGGIAFDEVDGSLMLRRRPGTFVAGEMLDWEAPTGGYLLQATFSTAVAAAHGAIAWLADA